MQESDKNQIAAMLKYLQNATQAAKAYLTNEDIEQAPEVINIHVTYVSQRIERLERTIASINRRLKSDEVLVPDEAEEAHELVRDLNIRAAELDSIRKQRERIAHSAALAAETLEASKKESSQVQVVLSKPPLPPLPLKRFAGDPMEFTNFITVFDETVHKNTALGPSQKLLYLQSYVDGEAKRLIGKIIITDENYEMARETLRVNFGHSSHMITKLYDRLHDVPRARNDPFSIRDTYTEVEGILQMLEHIGVNVNNDSYLRHEVMKKWPFNLVQRLVKTTDGLQLEKFRQDLKKEIELQIELTQATGYIAPPQQQRPKPYDPKNQRKNPAVAGYSGTQQTKPDDSSKAASSSTSEVPMPAYSARCPFCQNQHFAEACDKYKTAVQRKEKLGDKKCHKCFRDTHTGTPCIRNRKCSYCSSWEHNRALCTTKYPEESAKCLLTEQESEQDPPGLFVTFLAKASNPSTGETAELRILVDLACNRTAITEQAASKLGISIQNEPKQPTKGMGDRIVEPISEESVDLLLHTKDNEKIKFTTRLTKKIADDVPVPDLEQFRRRYPQYDWCHIPLTGAKQPVDVIVGSDRLLRILRLNDSLKVSDTCQLLATKFGWLVMMEERADGSEKENIFNFFTRTDDIVKFMWDLDLVGVKGLSEPDTELEERALKSFYGSIKYINGRYEIKWPWRTMPPNLNENYGLALGRLRTLLKKLQQQPELLAAYHSVILDQLKEGVMEDVWPNFKKGPVVHYIPHHAVVVLEKSTPVRIVSDAAATTGRNKSLNDNMLKGSKWLGNTVSSLLRFRKYGKGVSADIRHAFHQIAISPLDRDAVRFLWVHDPEKPPQGENLRVLRFCRVAFGIVASPFLLYATIQYHLRGSGSRYAEKIGNEMYADNLLISLPKETDEIEFYNETKKLFRSMSMDMTKWKTNSTTLTEFIPSNDKLSENEISVLGLAWRVNEDTFGLRPPKISHLEGTAPTKRVVLKTMASIFDPLGWSAPFILQIRLFLRGLWQEQKTWDVKLNDKEIELWSRLKQEMNELTKIEMRRQLFTEEIDENERGYELHTFVDASAEAVGVVSYLRQSSESSNETAFLMAKTRLSPPTKLSIPRLEYYALILGARTQKFVVDSLQMKKELKSYMWSDSKCVLAWVASNRLLPMAVERYLPEIRGAGVYQFRYVPTAFNPADVVSRGMPLSELRATSWLDGPSWLRDESTWPIHVDVTCINIETFEEEKKVLFIQGQNKVEIGAPFGLDHTKFSEWKVLLRRTAYCVWFLHNYLKKEILSVRSPIDYDRARMLWLRWDQRRNGSDQPELLKKIAHFKGVQLFTDESGVLRCKTRLENSNLPWATTSPIILVKGSHITELIILDIHRRNFHSGTAHTLAVLRKSYWLIHGRREVYRIINKKCLRCRENKAKPFVAPEEPPLPSFRITQTSHPFENTGIDIFGPLNVLVSKEDGSGQKVVKRWILLFTCLVVRALHLEILTGVETIDIICAIKRFTARRGTPSLILSDNAKQFHLVNGCLKDIWTEFGDDEATSRYFAENCITWKFTPEHAPWMGGAYERLVQVTKNALKKTYGEQELTELEFNTTIIEIEGVINNRPITYIGRENSALLLTPNHFLRAMFPAIPVDVTKREQHQLSTKERVLQYWKAAEESLNIYWRVWSDHYLLALREMRGKNAEQRIKPAVGQIVLMVDPVQRRGYWRTGRIERLINSADGQVRSAQVRFPSGNVMVRPITKLVPVEYLDNLPEECASSSALVVSGEDADVPSADPSEIDTEAVPIVMFRWSWDSVNKKR